MKKQLFLISLIFAAFSLSSQEVATDANSTPAATADTTVQETPFCPHRILLRAGAGWNNNVYNKIDNVNQNYSVVSGLEVGYTYFFNDWVGLGLGLGVSNIQAKGVFNNSGTYENVNDPSFNPLNPAALYDLSYDMTNLSERQNIWAIEIPLTAQFEHRFGGRHGIYAGVGVKGYIPIYSRTNFPMDEANISLKIYEEATDALYENLPGHTDDVALTAQSSKMKMRASVDVLAEFGGIINISKSADFYIGGYFSYGFLDILPKEKTPYIETAADRSYTINGLTNSDIASDEWNGKWNRMSAGVKVGFHFLPCKANQNDKSLREQRREYMKAMKDQAEKAGQEPQVIIIRDTIPVTVTIEYPEELLEEKQNKKDVQELAEALTSLKVLFDFDKADPKISGKEAELDRIADILKENSSIRLVVEGYTSPEGSDEYNKKLAQRRADNVANILIGKGAPASKISTAAYTVKNSEHQQNIKETSFAEQRTVIFRILAN